MTLTAGDVLTGGKLLAMPFLREDLTAPGPLLRTLTGLELDVARQVAIYAPERLSAAGATASIEPTFNLTGYSLSPGIAYTAFTYLKENDAGVPISINTEGGFPTAWRHPGGIVRLGGSQAEFFPADPLGRSWQGSDVRPWFSDVRDQFAYRYVPLPSLVMTLSQALYAPDECRDYLEQSLAAQILEQAATTLPVPRERILSHRESALMARGEFLRNLVKRQRRDVAHGEPRLQQYSSSTAWIVTAA